MKFTEWIRHRIVGRFREPDHRELQEIAQKAKRLAGVYNHGELAKHPGSTVIRKKSY